MGIRVAVVVGDAVGGTEVSVGRIGVAVGGTGVGVASTGFGVGVASTDVRVAGVGLGAQAVRGRIIPSVTSKSHSLFLLIVKPPFDGRMNFGHHFKRE